MAHFLAALTLGQRRLCAAAILARLIADIFRRLRLGWDASNCDHRRAGVGVQSDPCISSICNHDHDYYFELP